MWSINIIYIRKRFFRNGNVKLGIPSRAISNWKTAKNAARGTHSLAITVDGAKKIVRNLKSLNKKYNYDRLIKSWFCS